MLDVDRDSLNNLILLSIIGNIFIGIIVIYIIEENPENPLRLTSLVRKVIKRMKKFLFLLLLFSTIVETSNTKPTLTTLILKSSEILTDYEGSLKSYIKPLNVERVQYYSNEYNTTIEIYELEPTQKYELLQIGELSFLVLGSPIEWYNNEVQE